MKYRLMSILEGCGQKLGEWPGLGKPRQKAIFHRLSPTWFPTVGPEMKEDPGGHHSPTVPPT